MSKKTERNTAKPTSKSSLLSKDYLFNILNLTVQELERKYKLNSHEIIHELQNSLTPSEISIPCSIFTSLLSPFETICKFLKENHNLTFAEIARKLNRDNRTIWTTYQNAQKKHRTALVPSKTDHHLPLSIFTNRNLSALEAIVLHLKSDYNMTFKQISLLLHRDQRNIWTVHNRATKKLEASNEK